MTIKLFSTIGKASLSTLAAILLCGVTAGAQIKVVGHRGVRFNTPEVPETPYYENTIPALEFCQSLGVYAAEFDIQLTSDNKIIVFHGPKVPGLDKSIQEITYKEARAVTLPSGSKMPTFKEYLKKAKKHPETRLICEIKPQSTKERETMAVEQVVAAVKKMGMRGQFEYTTFSDWTAQEIHRLDPEAKVLFLDGGKKAKDPDYCKSRGYNAISYDTWAFKHHPEYVARAHELGMEVTMWVVNDSEFVDKAISLGIDYVSSDHPERIKAYVDSLASKEEK
jgi:glycerophosphoryl diester phosphodiesterase